MKLTGWCSTQSCCEGFFADDLSQSKVSKLDGQVLVCEQNVLRLDVAVDDVAFMLHM